MTAITILNMEDDDAADLLVHALENLKIRAAIRHARSLAARKTGS
jgi:hypothetical protein